MQSHASVCKRPKYRCSPPPSVLVRLHAQYLHTLAPCQEVDALLFGLSLLLTPCSQAPSRLRPPPLVRVGSRLPQLPACALVPRRVCVWGWCRRWVGPWAARSGGGGSSPGGDKHGGGKKGVLKRSALLFSYLAWWCRTLTKAKAASRKASVMPATTPRHCHTDSDRR